MIGSELYDLATWMNGGQPLDEDMFYVLLNTKKNERESARDWMILREFDNSNVFTSADGYDGTKPLPDNFLRIYAPYDVNTRQQTGVFIVAGDGRKVPLSPIEYAKRYDYKDIDGYYYVDYKRSQIGRTGNLAGTMNLYFLEGTDDIDADTEWAFPSYAHPVLAFDVVMSFKGGIDWDTVNANQVPFNAADMRRIDSSLNMWDARLQQNAIGV